MAKEVPPELLSLRQQLLLDFLRNSISSRSVVPSITEIQGALGYASPNAVVKLLDKLEEKGAIEREAGTRRSLRILWADPSDEPSRRRPPHRIPLLGRIAAGIPITAASDAAEQATDFLDIDPTLFDTPPDMLWRVEGLSMVNAGILPGDLVGTSFRSDFANRQIVAAVVIDENTDDPTLTLKRYRRKGSIITLTSENDDQSTYKPLVFDTRVDRVQIIGIYCCLVRSRVQ